MNGQQEMAAVQSWPELPPPLAIASSWPVFTPPAMDAPAECHSSRGCTLQQIATPAMAAQQEGTPAECHSSRMPLQQNATPAMPPTATPAQQDANCDFIIAQMALLETLVPKAFAAKPQVPATPPWRRTSGALPAYMPSWPPGSLAFSPQYVLSLFM